MKLFSNVIFVTLIYHDEEMKEIMVSVQNKTLNLNLYEILSNCVRAILFGTYKDLHFSKIMSNDFKVIQTDPTTDF